MLCLARVSPVRCFSLTPRRWSWNFSYLGQLCYEIGRMAVCPEQEECPSLTIILEGWSKQRIRTAVRARALRYVGRRFRSVLRVASV